ncbi:MAG: Cytochrome [Pseudomonadota bacterium]|nr:Cytochrome [Pseudomonadota bacterium]
MTVSFLKKLVNLAIILAWAVLMLGAYTRLTDAGLGCPDWPGCYGHLVMPAVDIVQKAYPHTLIESAKAWTEMAHRYLAGSLVFIIMSILIGLRFQKRDSLAVSTKLQVFLLVLIGFQAALGMWTVTLKLVPQVVSGHLLGGFLIFSSLIAMRSQMMPPVNTSWACVKSYIGLGLLMTLIQIALGAWVSSNYAAISCIGFPMCNGQWIPPLHLKEAFHLIQQIGPNYQGGLLDIDVRMTIQWVHRLGAFIVFVYWSVLSCVLLKKIHSQSIHRIVWLLISLLILQVILGVINVSYLLPLYAAVLHNGVGALILGTIVMIFQRIQCEKKTC